MPSSIIDFLREQQARGWAGFRGGRVSGTLPVSESVLMDLAGQQPLPRGLRLTGIRILADGVVRVEVVVGASLLSKRLSPELRVSGVTGVPERPTVTVAVPRAYSVMLSRALRARPLGFARFDGQELTLDVRELLEQRAGEAAASMLPLLRRADIRTEPGAVVVDFELAVE